MPRLSKAAQEDVSLESIACRICRKLKVDIKDLRKKGRNSNSSRARKIIAYRAHREYAIPVIEIALFFGVASCSVSNMLAKGEKLAEKLRN